MVVSDVYELAGSGTGGGGVGGGADLGELYPSSSRFYAGGGDGVGGGGGSSSRPGPSPASSGGAGGKRTTGDSPSARFAARFGATGTGSDDRGDDPARVAVMAAAADQEQVRRSYPKSGGRLARDGDDDVPAAFRGDGGGGAGAGGAGRSGGGGAVGGAGDKAEQPYPEEDADEYERRMRERLEETRRGNASLPRVELVASRRAVGGGANGGNDDAANGGSYDAGNCNAGSTTNDNGNAGSANNGNGGAGDEIEDGARSDGGKSAREEAIEILNELYPVYEDARSTRPSDVARRERGPGPGSPSGSTGSAGSDANTGFGANSNAGSKVGSSMPSGGANDGANDGEPSEVPAGASPPPKVKKRGRGDYCTLINI